ncbi:MAG: glycosyl transferase group 1, partial [Frankiales bacterium]|nr:glycosyl transferase group 1 [Frankiales bacterium]
MRLLLDLQCVQSTSAVRGIGRYALSLSQALVATAGPDDRVEVLLNGGDDPVRLLRARTALETFLPARAVHVFDAPWPWQHDPSPLRHREAEAVRAAAVDSLRPDVLLVGSVFEGDKETVLSIDGEGVPTAALLYDLIPAADPGTYLLGPGADSYWRRFRELQRADLLLSISAYSGQQARELLGDACPPVVPVWGGPYPSGLFAAFEERAVTTAPVVPERYLLAVGGDHPRKNLDRLVQAWG